MKRNKFLIVTMALVMLLTVACGSGSNGGQAEPGDNSASESAQTDEKKAMTVSMMTSQGKYKETYKKIAEKLKTEENIILEIQVVPDDQYYNLVKTKISMKEVPDIIMHNAPSEYVTVNAQKNMEDLSNEPWVERLSNPNLLKAEDGKIYAMPQESSSFYAAIYYNKKVFEDLGLSEPKTYAEFLSLLETIKSKGDGITPIYMSNKDSWTTQIFVTAALPVLLGDKAEETWEGLLSNKLKWADIPEFKQAMELFQELYVKGYTNKDHVTQTFDNAKAALAEGKAAMVFNGEWTVGDLINKNEMNPDEIGAFVLPFGDQDIIATGAYVQGFMVPKDAKNVEGAKKVLELWSQPDYMNIYFAENPGFPGFTDVDGGDVHPAIKALEDNYIKTNKYVYQLNDPMAAASSIFPDLWTLYVDMAAGSKTPDDVVKAWDKKYEDFMNQIDQPGF